jgi:hypothetical protein
MDRIPVWKSVARSIPVPGEGGLNSVVSRVPKAEPGAPPVVVILLPKEPGNPPKAVSRTTGSLALELMQKDRERRQMEVYWPVAGKAKWKFRLKRTSLWHRCAAD